MSHHFYKSLRSLVIASLFVTPYVGAAALQPDFVKPLKELFSHKAHLTGFNKMGVTCSDCHTFSVKSVGTDPLATGVEKGFLSPDAKRCHQCHLRAVSVAIPNQCSLCHKTLARLKPETHNLGWRVRHGAIAQIDSDSCKQCHTEQNCSQCHTQRDALKPNVHRPNFRLTHSIEARGNPQSCTTCHANLNTCVQCHTKGIQ